ncbi:hypothetical protein J2857_004833 [Neorhizobium galegae]|nr:hypothetical protein [Neorhizobium galegae]MBP2562042.1 hypothetical protein [Neorhizobium galegae]
MSDVTWNSRTVSLAIRAMPRFHDMSGEVWRRHRTVIASAEGSGKSI